MKKIAILAGALLAGVSAWTVIAQDAPQQPGQRPPGGGGGFGGQGRPMFMSASVFDANKDGVIDATEIANASAALRKLDKNHDGKLTADEIRPQRPEGFGGPGGPGGGSGGHRGNRPQQQDQ